MKSLDKILKEGMKAGSQAFEKMEKTAQSQAFAKKEQQIASTGQKAKYYNLEQVKSYVMKLKELNLPKNLVIQAVNEIYGV